MSVIEISQLTKDYGHGRGIFDVSLSVAEGQVYGFLGPNGAGKSTTIRHIMGFSRPQSGSISVFGEDTFKSYYKILGRVGYLPGEIALPEGLLGTEFIDMMEKLRGIENKELTKSLLERFELNPKADMKKMSLGDKRKLAIVVAFMHDPELLILDEPTSGLDPVMQEVFINFVKEEKKRGKTIFLSSHMFNEVEKTCDIISIIKDGRIVSTFEAGKIKHNRNKIYKIRFADLAEMNKFVLEAQGSPLYNRSKNKAFYIRKVDKNKQKVTFNVVDNNINALVALVAKYKVVEFRQDRFTLEDYFMQFYREDKKFAAL